MLEILLKKGDPVGDNMTMCQLYCGWPCNWVYLQNSL